MMNRENTTSIPAYYDVVIEKGKTMYLSKLTLNSEMTVPANPRGGMLLDEMGLGKTLQVIRYFSIYFVEVYALFLTV